MFKSKLLTFCVLSIFGLWFGEEARSQEKLTLTLDEAIDIALTESPTVKIADLTVQKTGYAKKGTYASLYPNISLNGNYQRTIKKQVMAMEMNGQTMEIEVGMSNNISAGVTAAMPLVNAQLWKSLKLSAIDVEIAVEKARSSKIAMVSEVKQAFFGVLFAKEALNLYKETYDNQVRNFENVEKKYNVGKVSEFEYLRAQVNMKNAEPNVYSGETAVELAIWQLKAVMGIDFETELDVVGEIKDYKDPLVNPSIEQLEYDVEHNTNLVQLGLQNEQIDAAIKQYKYGYLPTLSASFNYNYVTLSNDFDFHWNPYCVAGLTLSIPIFDGLSKHYNISQYKKTQEILKLTIEDTKRQIQIGAKNYTDVMQTCVKRYAAAESTLSMAQKSYNIAEKMFEVGKATIIELNDAELALMQAKLNISQSIYDYMVAFSKLNELIGNEYK